MVPSPKRRFLSRRMTPPLPTPRDTRRPPCVSVHPSPSAAPPDISPPPPPVHPPGTRPREHRGLPPDPAPGSNVAPAHHPHQPPTPSTSMPPSQTPAGAEIRGVNRRHGISTHFPLLHHALPLASVTCRRLAKIHSTPLNGTRRSHRKDPLLTYDLQHPQP